MGMKDFTGNPGTPPPPTGGGAPSGSGGFPGMDALDPIELVINYNDKYKTALPIMHRDNVIHQTLAILIGMTKPNPLLIGAAGTGKTKIVEDIARMIANDDPLIPTNLKGHTIYELPISNIVSGSNFVGDVEKKIKAVIEMVQDPKEKAILFIDEIHMLAEGSQTYEKIAQILKPALARGDMKTIGATTLQEANKLARDPAFNRRFTQVIVDELSQAQTLDILHSMKVKFFQAYGNRINFSDKVLETVVELADMYHRPGAHRPDTAITLLDRAAGETIINRILMEKQAQNDPALLQALQSVTILPITEKQIRTTAMRLMTGNNVKDSIDFVKLSENLMDIKGQDRVLKDIINLLRKYDANIHHKQNSNRPLTMLFAGTSGVGKTEVTKRIAQTMTNVSPITLNMTEFHSSADINRIIGSPAGYIGSDSSAELPFDTLESNPYQVILLDEFEKAHRSVQRLFMGAFNDGYITTSQGRKVDFSKAIVIVTTNAGFKGTAKGIGFAQSDNNENQRHAVADRLKGYFDPELLGRFDLLTDFASLDKTIYREILQNLYEKEVHLIKKKSPYAKLSDTLTDDQLDRLVETTYVAAFGARPAEQAVMDIIAEQML